jgi:hypothetical protein
VAAQQALPKIIGRAEEGVRLIDELIGKRDSKGRLIVTFNPTPTILAHLILITKTM